MLESLAIENFKIHKQLNIDLGNLTVLTGLNSSGKSSIIQALLLLRQSFLQGVINEGLLLNGDILSVGLCRDALCHDADNDFISFGIQAGVLSSWKWRADSAIMGKDFLPILETNNTESESLKKFSLFTNEFQYISAARQEPSETYPLNTNLVETKKQISQKYGKCELAAHFLHYYGVERKIQVLEGLKRNDEDASDLLSQVSSWEHIISPDVRVIPEKGDKSYSLGYSYKIGGDTSQPFSATNVGFGLSYSLPIIVALLSAVRGSLILIENPEAHLHESAQSELGTMIARAAQAGVQVIVETHSNHIINGILVASKRQEDGDKGVERSKVKLYYVKKQDNILQSEFDEIKIEEGGKIDHQPDGFFNRIESDMTYLLG